MILPFAFASKPASVFAPPLFTLNIASAVSTVVEFTVVCVPCTVRLPVIIASPVRLTVVAVISSDKKLPVTVKLFPIVTSFGNPIWIWLSETVVSISLLVPAKFRVSVPTVTVSLEPESAPIVNVLDVEAVLTAVILPLASTVITGIALLLP